MAVKTQKQGSLSISIEALKNIPEEIKIFLQDKQNNTFYNLREKDFTSDIAPGNCLDRFAIVFNDNSAPEDPTEPEEPTEPETEKEEKLSINYISSLRQLVIINPNQIKIHSIILFDINGKKLETIYAPGNQKEKWLKIGKYQTGVYIARMLSETGSLSKVFIVKAP